MVYFGFKYVLIIIIELHLISWVICFRNNVCKTLEDYQNMGQNPNCWYNEDVGASPRKITERYGFPFENYEIKTDDGYLITLFRIPHNGTDINKKRPPVFFHHCLAADGVIWMLQGLQSMVFVFANKGYDVWLTNARGTSYSSHVEYAKEDPKFWDFSFHEIALYDLPAIFKFINLKTRKKDKITYIGLSMGSTASYIYASLKPDEAIRNLKTIISLAPVSYMSHLRGLIKTISPFDKTIADLLILFDINDSNKHILEDYFKNFCPQSPFLFSCLMLIEAILGRNEAEIVASVLPVLLSHVPAEFSLKQFKHYGQIINSESRFHMYDYGPDTNLKFYNSIIPPEYPLERIKVPVHLIYGTHDLFATPEDAFLLYNRLKTKKTISKMGNFTHANFVGSQHAMELYELMFAYV